MKVKIRDKLDCDVLIIGTGGAGMMAALKAAEKGTRVTLINKGKPSTEEISALNVPLGHENPKDSPQALLEDILDEGGSHNDPKLAKILAQNSIKIFRELVEYGVPFEKESGRFQQRLTSGNSYPRTVFWKDILGKKISSTLLGKIKREDNIEVLNDAMVTDLLTKGDQRVIGAIGFKIKEENFFMVRAKAVVLTTGGAGNLYPITTNPPGITGDGYILAHQLGAKLVDLDFIQFEPIVVTYPNRIKGTVVPTALLGEGAILVNSNGEPLMKLQNAQRKQMISKDVLTQSIFSEITHGRGTDHDGVFFDATSLPNNLVEEGFPVLFKTLLSEGIDLREEPIEVSPAAHYMMGGVQINEKCETTISGLFAAGEVAGGIHGSSRIAGNSATDILVFGSRAGKYSANVALSKKPSISMSELTDVGEKALETNHVQSTCEKSDEARSTLQSIMLKYVGVVRTQPGLTKALSEISDLQNQLETISIKDVDKFKKDQENRNLLKLGDLVTRSALHRKGN